MSIKQLRKTRSVPGVDWEQLCVTHPAMPQFNTELLDDTVQLRLLARSDRDQSKWIWNGHDWQPDENRKRQGDKPEILDDPRLEPVTQWFETGNRLSLALRFSSASRGRSNPPCRDQRTRTANARATSRKFSTTPVSNQ